MHYSLWTPQTELAVVNIKSRFIILFIFKANIFWQASVWLVVRTDPEGETTSWSREPLY